METIDSSTNIETALEVQLAPQPSLANSALQYATIGLPVFPAAPGGKNPFTKQGFKDASTDAAKIAQWWKDHPKANIAIATGKKSGFFVLDVDGAKGKESIAKLVSEHGEFPDTIIVTTGSGGYHLYFRYQPDRPVRCRVQFLEGLDIRSDGGYVIAPPSKTKNTYQFVEADSLNPDDIADAPEWLMDLIEHTPHLNEDYLATVSAGKAISNGVPEGRRDIEAIRIAGRLRAQFVTKESAYAALEEFASKCSPPLPIDQARAKVDQAWDYPARPPLTDLGNAQRLVNLHGQDFHYNATSNKWMVWNGMIWETDHAETVMRFAKETALHFAVEAGLESDFDIANKIVKHGFATQNVNRLQAMINLAKSEEGISIKETLIYSCLYQCLKM